MPRKFVASFVGRASIEAVSPWIGCEVEVPAGDLPPLDEGRYYHFQLIGLRVHAADGRFVGVLEEILGTGGNDVYCVRDGRREVLIPAGGGVIQGIDLVARTMTVRDLEGLIEP
jgi:16S rRNA processing protein RimM